jgi:hypothetical protein
MFRPLPEERVRFTIAAEDKLQEARQLELVAIEEG